MVPVRTTKDIRVNRRTGKKKARPLTADDFSEEDRVREKEIRRRAAEAAGPGYDFKCLVCDKQFRSRVGFTYHMRQNVCYKRAQRQEREKQQPAEIKLAATKSRAKQRKRKRQARR